MTRRAKQKPDEPSPGPSQLAQLHPDTRDMLLRYVGAVGFIGPAARAVGIGERSARRWVARGVASVAAVDEAWARREAGEQVEIPPADEPYHSFAMEVEERRASALVQTLAQITLAAASDVKAAMWRAAKLDPMLFGDRVQFAGDVEAPLVFAPPVQMWSVEDRVAGTLAALEEFRRSQQT